MREPNGQPIPTVGTDRSAARLAGRPVRRVGFGAMPLAEWDQQSAPDREAAVAVLRRAVELGVDHIDTADFYGGGVVNNLIRTALHPYPDHLVLVSKVGAEHDYEKDLVPAQRPQQLRAGVEANLHRLGVEQLTAVNLRRLDTGPDLDSQLAEMVAMRDEGKIGGWRRTEQRQSGAAAPGVVRRIVCVQNSYNLLDRSSEGLLDECREQNVAWVPFFPLGSAFAGMPKVTNHPAVIAAATALDVTPAQIGLAWLLAHEPHVLLIPRTSTAGHLAQNVAAADIHLDAETMHTLDALAGAHPSG